MSARVHAAMAKGVPVPCQCELGFHHEADGTPVREWTADQQMVRAVGRHPYCIGACVVWGTPTEEFDFVLVRGLRLNSHRIATGLKVVDLGGTGDWVEYWGDDRTFPCQQLGMLRLAMWRRNRPPDVHSSTNVYTT